MSTQSSPMRTRTSPFVGSSTPAMILETLVFPAPLNPMRPKTSPSWISNETLLTALITPRSSVTYFFSSSATFTIVSPEAISCFFISPTVLKNSSTTSFGAPSLAIIPLSSSIALSAIDSMSSGRCEVTSTAISFVLASCRIILWMISAVFRSRVPVGSSASKMIGDLASWRAKTTRCFSPPLRSRAMCIIRCDNLT